MVYFSKKFVASAVQELEYSSVRQTIPLELFFQMFYTDFKNTFQKMKTPRNFKIFKHHRIFSKLHNFCHSKTRLVINTPNKSALTVLPNQQNKYLIKIEKMDISQDNHYFFKNSSNFDIF